MERAPPQTCGRLKAPRLQGSDFVTSISSPSRSILRFCNKRGTAEQWIKEGKQATNWTRLSCHRFRANIVSG